MASAVSTHYLFLLSLTAFSLSIMFPASHKLLSTKPVANRIHPPGSCAGWPCCCWGWLKLNRLVPAPDWAPPNSPPPPPPKAGVLAGAPNSPPLEPPKRDGLEAPPKGCEPPKLDPKGLAGVEPNKPPPPKAGVLAGCRQDISLQMLRGFGMRPSSRALGLNVQFWITVKTAKLQFLHAISFRWTRGKIWGYPMASHSLPRGSIRG